MGSSVQNGASAPAPSPLGRWPPRLIHPQHVALGSAGPRRPDRGYHPAEQRDALGIAQRLAALLADDGRDRRALAERRADQRLGREVGDRDRAAVALFQGLGGNQGGLDLATHHDGGAYSGDGNLELGLALHGGRRYAAPGSVSRLSRPADTRYSEGSAVSDAVDAIDYLALDDDELLRQCEVDTYRGSGPGGQKRNKTSSAVRLRHAPTGVLAAASDTRSQHSNRKEALRRLRERIALEVRRPVHLDPYCCPAHVAGLFLRGVAGVRKPDADYLRGVQALLDLFVATGCSVRETAARVGATTGALSRFLLADDVLARRVHELRGEREMRPLR